MISSLLYVVIFIPLWIYDVIRNIFTGKPVWAWEDIIGAYGEVITVHYFNNKPYFLKLMGLLTAVFNNDIHFVGISIRHSESKLNPLHPLWQQKPGMFNLWFIRNSLKMAHEGRDEVDLEYIHHKSFAYDLLIILKTIPALLFHQDMEVDAKHVTLLDIQFYNIEMQDAVNMIDHAIVSQAKTNVFFINADCLNKTVKDKEYLGVLQANDMIFPDGSGINLACKMIGQHLKANINGTDMFPRLCELSQEKGYRIYLLGAKPGVVDKMRERITRQYPCLLIVGSRNGYFDKKTQSPTVIQEINESQADLLFVAFGAPFQEKWINQYAGELNTWVNLGVGGLFDFYSDTIPRAPQWMRELGIEWVYRLIQEPRRMWKRYILGNPLFMYRVYRWEKNIEKR
jgi:N-acetylglucosaminyldiphosphoundecaprenol N-acetyl-beta-D-mannosaminyltransferase